MRWNKYTINTRTDAEELVCAMLSELGITSVEIDNFIPVPDADRQGGVFEELQPDLPEDDGSSRISFYLEEDEADASEILEKVRQALDDMSTYAQMARVRSRLKSQTRRIGVTTGKPIFLLFPSAIFLLNLPGKTCRRTNRT